MLRNRLPAIPVMTNNAIIQLDPNSVSTPRPNSKRKIIFIMMCIQLKCRYMDAINRIHYYVDDPSTSFFIWLRLIVGQTMINIHRRHLGTQMRDANREISIQNARARATSETLAAHLLGQFTSPSQAAMRAEISHQLEAALESMSPIDREVLALRHFEELTNSEVAEVLGIQHKAASIRYVRAISRLKSILEEVPGFLG